MRAAVESIGALFNVGFQSFSAEGLLKRSVRQFSLMNAGMLVGHNTLRLMAMGMADACQFAWFRGVAPHSVPNRTMTNGAIGNIVTGVDGPVVAIEYKDCGKYTPIP